MSISGYLVSSGVPLPGPEPVRDDDAGIRVISSRTHALLEPVGHLRVQSLKATRCHRAPWRRGGSMVTRGPHAAAGEAADHRVSLHDQVLGLETIDSAVPIVFLLKHAWHRPGRGRRGHRGLVHRPRRSHQARSATARVPHLSRFVRIWPLRQWCRLSRRSCAA
jgi:hypothetical protein